MTAPTMMGSLGEAFPVKEIADISDRLLRTRPIDVLQYGATEGYTPLREHLKTGPATGKVNELQVMLKEYYAERGWEAEGIPTPEKLEALSIKQ